MGYSEDQEPTINENYTFDRTAFQQFSVQEADEQMTDSISESPKDRLRYSLYLTARAFGFDPDHRPPMDRYHFEIIHRDG